MATTLEEKIDKIAKDVSYMSGQFDTVIPLLQKTVDNHENRISEQEKKSENMAGKASVIGGIMGAVGGAILSFLTTRL